jgi:hypothetical protein
VESETQVGETQFEETQHEQIHCSRKNITTNLSRDTPLTETITRAIVRPLINHQVSATEEHLLLLTQ